MFLLRLPIKLDILPGEFMQGVDNPGKVMDKPPVVRSEPKKSAQFTKIPRLVEVRDGRYNPGIGLQALRSY